MKNLRKVILCLVLVVAVIFSVSGHVSAASCKNHITYLTGNDNDEKGIQTFALAQCGRYANHDMLSRGWGTIRKTNGEQVVYMGPCYQCTRCNLVFISQGTPETSSIGYWATSMAEGPVNTITVLTTKKIHYTSSKTISGMDFRYRAY